MAIDLGEAKHEPQELMETTKQLVQGQADLFTYERKMTYCVNCKKSWFGLLHKCPSCGAVGALAFFDRFANT
jgi:anaerobic ribonucleoside-triphosphate reductase